MSQPKSDLLDFSVPIDEFDPLASPHVPPPNSEQDPPIQTIPPPSMPNKENSNLSSPQVAPIPSPIPNPQNHTLQTPQVQLPPQAQNQALHPGVSQTPNQMGSGQPQYPNPQMMPNPVALGQVPNPAAMLQAPYMQNPQIGYPPNYRPPQNPIPFLLHARIRKISNAPSGEQYRNTRKVAVFLRGSDERQEAPLKGLHTLQTEQAFTFLGEDIYSPNNAISIELYEPTYQNLLIARLTIPLSWLQPDTIVNDDYPMKPHIAQISQPFCEIDLHLAVNMPDMPPFAAPPGHLTIIPTWRRPGAPMQPQIPGMAPGMVPMYPYGGYMIPPPPPPPQFVYVSPRPIEPGQKFAYPGQFYGLPPQNVQRQQAPKPQDKPKETPKEKPKDTPPKEKKSFFKKKDKNPEYTMANPQPAEDLQFKPSTTTDMIYQGNQTANMKNKNLNNDIGASLLDNAQLMPDSDNLSDLENDPDLPSIPVERVR